MTRLRFAEIWTRIDADGWVVPSRATFRGSAVLRAASPDEFLRLASDHVFDRFPNVRKLYINLPDGELVEVTLRRDCV